MGCTAIAPGMTADERGRFIDENLPAGLFRVADGGDERVAWRIAPEPFGLSPATAHALETLGDDLLAFYRALNALYTRSVRGTAPPFIAEYLDQGKPEHVIKLARQNRFRSDLIGVIRPDLILTEDGFVATELDSLPGGMGFVGAMTDQYCRIGFESFGGSSGIPEGLASLFSDLAGHPHPVAAIVVSEESADYRAELTWLAQRITASSIATVYCVGPQDIIFTEQALFVRLPDGREEKIDVLYRNFEMFDLLNVPKWELMFYAARKNRVHITPPPKAQLEEKLAFALLHHPLLEEYWRAELDATTFERLLHADAANVDPRSSTAPAASRNSLTERLRKAGKQLGSAHQTRKIGARFSRETLGFLRTRVGRARRKDRKRSLARRVAGSTARCACGLLDHTTYSCSVSARVGVSKRSGGIARTTRSKRWTDASGYHPTTLPDGHAKLGGVLATVAPADKRLIHGMRDAVMAPCIVTKAAFSL